jgi:predicted small secreted protein
VRPTNILDYQLFLNFKLQFFLAVLKKGMKYIVLLAFALVFSSCNTCIGVYRDAKQGVIWTQQKIQGTGRSGGTSDPYGAPTY